MVNGKWLGWEAGRQDLLLPFTNYYSLFTAYCPLHDNRHAPDRIRTCDPRIRSPMLYPAELRGPIQQSEAEP